MGKFRCTVCNWVYDEQKEGESFSDLPETYTCPVCGAPKIAFVSEESGAGERSNQTTVADKIAEQLETLGVKFIYGIPGDSNLPLIEAIRKRGSIRFVLTRHEETAAFMASAHGKITSQMGVCISIAGPGATNLITGLIDAATDRSPVLALAGQVPELYLGSEAFQEIDQIDIFKPFSEYAETVVRSNQALKLVLRATQYSYKKPGVSVLSTPTDVLSERLSAKVYQPGKRVFSNAVAAGDREIKKAATLINSSSRPAILAGWGARDASKLVLDLARKIKSPVATTSRAKGMIHETHKHSVGVLGSIGSKQAAQSIRNCDLVIIIGSGFRQANLAPAAARIVQLDIDSTRIGKTFDADAGLVGDTALTLKALLPYIQTKRENREFWSGIAQLKADHDAEIAADAADLAFPISPGYAIQAIKRNISSDAIICVDVGDHTYWFFKKFLCEGQRVLMSANVASMGFALPAALSAKLAYPEKQVVCIAGDGGFGMLMADFTTAVRENLAIKAIVFNDSKLKNIKKEQKRDGYPEFGVTFPNPNFAQFARSCGGEGFRIDDPNDLDAALQQAFASDKPAIVEIMDDPEKMAFSTKRVD